MADAHQNERRTLPSRLKSRGKVGIGLQRARAFEPASYYLCSPGLSHDCAEDAIGNQKKSANAKPDRYRAHTLRDRQRLQQLKRRHNQSECNDHGDYKRDNPQPEEYRGHALLRHIRRLQRAPCRRYQQRQQTVEKHETIERNRDSMQGKHQRCSQVFSWPFSFQRLCSTRSWNSLVTIGPAHLP